MPRRVIGAALVALVVAGSSAATGQAQAEPVVLHVPGDVHLVTVLDGSSYTVAHTIRHANGSWDGFGTLGLGQFLQMTSTIVNGEEHLLHDFRNNHPPQYDWIVDRIRHADGTWSETSSPAVAGGIALELAAPAVSGEMHVVRRSVADPAVRHHVRHADGTWSDLPTLPAPAALEGSVAVAGYGGELRLLYIGPDLATVSYYTAQADGVWSTAVQVPFDPPAPGVTPSAVEAAQVGTDLHAVVRGSDGLLYHAKRDVNGAWTRFWPIGSQTPVPPNVSSVSITAASGVLHVAVSAGGGLYHSIRLATGAWQPFGDVLGEAGRWVRARAVSIAGD
ncbi:MAG: hypothetical protein HOV94_22335 [Saccharothrix sp.]|nr:hypothetical protein [Saccharothrix sp.]